MPFFAYLTWDPSPTVFTLPFIHHPVTWYGLFFGTGFLVGYFLLCSIFDSHCRRYSSENSTLATKLADQLILFISIATLIGARLGHVFLYGWSYYQAHPEKIIRVWEGGLASHGGAIGILIALLLFWWLRKKKQPPFTLLALLDAVVLPAGLACGAIRLGNFMNQEILGVPTTMPWGVIFLHPIEGIFPVDIPLHPVQLYEALTYFAIFGFLFFLWKRRGKRIGEGVYAALFFLLLFGCRFFIEFFKQPESDLLQRDGFLNMGQWLSIPFILLGAILLTRSVKRAQSL